MPDKHLIRSGSTLKRLQRAARDATRAVKELERLQEADLFGRLSYMAGDVPDLNEIGEFLRMARAEYPNWNFDLLLVAREPGMEVRDEQGTTAELQRRSAAEGADGARRDYRGPRVPSASANG